MNIGRLTLPSWKWGAAQAGVAADPDLIAAPMPRILWIELTSKCPFDCIFCTRRTRFGAGRNLDFDLYRRVIGELDAPDFIGLNYSGESLYYPELISAIRLASATGAATELVTAFSTVTQPLLRQIVESGLDRLAVSLHTMDAAQYGQIYRFGSLDLLKSRIADFLELKASLGTEKPRLDFCFVGMSENLGQLPAVADYARSAGVRELSIHPIIGRHPTAHDFSRELETNRLRSNFKQELRTAIESVRAAEPNFTVNVLNPDLDSDPRLGRAPGYYSPSLPPDGRIHSCDQSPFESVHILATGDVVVCEAHDEVPMGNLREEPLREIWRGERYREFRRRYISGADPECRRCVWKMAYLPGPALPAIAAADGMSAQLLRGWHGHDGDIVWSRKRALAVLGNARRAKRLRIAGMLPHAPRGEGNCLTVTVNRRMIGTVRNDSAAFAAFDTTLSLPEQSDCLYVELETSRPFRPSLYTASPDSRDLGVGLIQIEVRR